MNDSFLETFFHYFSRILIIIPIIIIIVGLALKSNQREQSTSTNNIVISPTAIIKQLMVTSSAQLNLQGPLICNFSSPTATTSGYIKEKKISVTVASKTKTTNFIYRDDCLNIWEKGSYSGQKICGLSSYLSLFDVFSKLNIFGSNNLISSLLPLIDDFDLASNEAEIKNLINYCKQEEIADLTVFEIPKSVLFKNEN